MRCQHGSIRIPVLAIVHIGGEAVLKLLRKAGVVFDRILELLMALASSMLVFAMLLVCTDVLMRYALNHALGWSIEISEAILVGVVSLGMAWLLKEEGHVKVDFLLKRLSSGSQALVTGIMSVIAAAALFMIAWFGLRITFEFMQSGTAIETGLLRIPKAYLLMPLGIGCFLFAVQFLRRSYRYLTTWKKRECVGEVRARL